MKILAIRGKNLASLGGEFSVEMEEDPLVHAGLFAITGPTGAGKSTLLDALCLALFDKTPRLATRGGVLIGRPDEDESLRLAAYDVRSLLRRGTGAGFAEVEFCGRDGRRYLARWDVRRARQRADGKLQPQTMNLHDLETGRVLGGTKSETLQAIEECLGLSFEQFRRSALLAQGEFAAFLQADARARAELLERMTGTEIYGAVSVAAFRRAADELGELRNLLKLCDEHAVLADGEREQLEAARAAARARLESLDREVAAADAAVAWHRRSRELRAAEAAAVDRAQVLGAQWTESAAWREQLDAVVAAQALRGVVSDWDRCSTAVEAGAARLSELDAAMVTATAARERYEVESVAARARHDAARAALEAARPELDEAARLDVEIRGAARACTEAAEALRHSTGRAEAAVAERDAAARRLGHVERRELDRLRDSIIGWARGAELVARHDSAEAGRERLDGAREAVLDAADAARAAVKRAAKKHAAATAALDSAKLKAQRRERAASAAPVVEARRSLDRAVDHRDALRALVDAADTARAAAQRRAALRDTAGRLANAMREAQSFIEELAGRRAASELAVAEAQRALDRMSLAVDLSAHRASLVDGEPCPLCGATEHPLGTSAFDDMLAEQRDRVARLRDQIATIDRERADHQARRDASAREAEAARADATGAEREIEGAREKWRTHLAALGELALLEDPTDDRTAEWARKRLTAIDAELGELREREAQAAELRREADHAHGVAEARRIDVDHARDVLREAERVAAQTASALSEHDRKREQLAELMSRTLDTLDGELRVEREAAARRATECAAETRRLAGVHASSSADRDRLSVRRATLLAGRPVDEVAGELTEAVQRTESVASRAAEALRLAAEAGVAKATEAKAAAAALERDRAALVESRSALDAALSRASIELEPLRVLLERDADWIAAQRARASELHVALEQARAVAAERTQQRAELDAQDAPSVSEDEAIAAVAAGRAAQEEATEAYSELVGKLRVDDEARAKRADLAARIAEQRDRAELYATLRELIGSADGKKFRVFAQSLTLDALLAFANEHLRELAGRYRLTRVPGHDLELQVIDRDLGDEVRSVNSLSGGESFLVSLALALGLSSLSARDTRVESLLIDEGFGSLDPVTLETALSVLDAVQASGRKVGLISHVPALAERVGVWVAVRPQGAGRSVVRTEAR